MGKAELSRLLLGDRLGVVGGVILAAIYIIGYVFGRDLISVAETSPWRVGQLGPLALIDGNIHIGFFLLPGFLVSTIAFLYSHWKNRPGFRGNKPLLVQLITIPIVTGAVFGLSVGILISGVVFNQQFDNTLTFLGFSVLIVVYHAIVMICFIGVSVFGGYSLARVFLRSSVDVNSG